jgi:tetratricopeptide (TPR) repeat protein
MKMRITTGLTWLVAAFALGAIALWPTFVKQSENAAHASYLPTPAPPSTDYLERDRTIAFWEGMVRKHLSDDMLSPRQLSMLYLQRYRERGDIDDVLRARRMAELSLYEQPRGNEGAQIALASVELTLHQFKAALAETKRIERMDPTEPVMRIREASLDLELGDYTGAKRIIDHLPPRKNLDVSRDTLVARYDELTGRLAEARGILERATAEQNSVLDAPAQQRAWFFFRSGEMAFEAGDNDAALADEDQALATFPNYAEANRLKAKFACALKRWQTCRDAALASANVVPYPETLGYEEDADRALGATADAGRIADLIVTIERIGNAQHISDRLLAIYYAEHRIRTADAYAIARRELSVRDDIFTEDTLAWAAAADGRWNEARTAAGKALRFDTENSLLQYHAAVIALHFGERDQARRRFEKALALNPSFHPVYADDARAELARL